MATTYASHAQSMIDAQTGAGTNSIRGTDALADLKYVPTVYTLTGSETADDIAELTAELPDNLVLVPALSFVTADNPGTALVVDVGHSGDADAYADGITLSSGGRVEFGSLWPSETALPAGNKVLLTFKTATSLTADAEIRFHLVFRAV